MYRYLDEAQRIAAYLNQMNSCDGYYEVVPVTAFVVVLVTEPCTEPELPLWDPPNAPADA
jgi:hypothetical protein